MPQLYCQVTSGAVTAGPEILPFSYGNVTGINVASDPTVYGFYPYTDPGAPAYDPNTQTLTRSFTVNTVAKTVTQAYAISALPLAQIQVNQQRLMTQSYSAKLLRQAQQAAAAGDTQSAVQYILQQQGTKP